jgi:hypothetical protein
MLLECLRSPIISVSGDLHDGDDVGIAMRSRRDKAGAQHI